MADGPAERLKFELLARGATITPEADATLARLTRDGAISPADYASTSGIIARLDGRVWVNIPVERHNPNFVSTTPYFFDHGADGFVLRGPGVEVPAEFWPLPAYHGGIAPSGFPLNHFVFTHGDRVRLSPTIGCAMECTFCNIPYDQKYGGVKDVDRMVEAIQVALDDPVQPAHHMLISGGTPGSAHVAGLRAAYETILTRFPGLGVDIMMVPVPGLFDLPRLDSLGLGELSINLELWNEDLASTVMRHKHRQGRQYYLDFLEEAAGVLGGHRVRSMLMVGIEDPADTLAGVKAIAERGCVPVLSPFRPDPATPMASHTPASADMLRGVYDEAVAIADAHGVALGPSCGPCTHNTLTFAPAVEPHPLPRLESGVL